MGRWDLLQCGKIDASEADVFNLDLKVALGYSRATWC